MVNTNNAFKKELAIRQSRVILPAESRITETKHSITTQLFMWTGIKRQTIAPGQEHDYQLKQSGSMQHVEKKKTIIPGVRRLQLVKEPITGIGKADVLETQLLWHLIPQGLVGPAFMIWLVMWMNGWQIGMLVINPRARRIPKVLRLEQRKYCVAVRGQRLPSVCSAHLGFLVHRMKPKTITDSVVPRTKLKNLSNGTIRVLC